MDLIFDYVLFHFKQVYHLPEPLEISYGVDGRSRVQVEKTQSDFFGQELPHPERVHWREWQGTSLPLFFPTAPAQEWFSPAENGAMVVHEDLIASAFILLSGWQEYHSTDRDRFGRFPFVASVQSMHRFVTIPVVNYYFEVLKVAVELAYGQPVRPRDWNGKPFVTCLTHDIDYCQSAWKVAGKLALQQGNIFRFLSLAWQKLQGREAWFNLPQVQRELQHLDAHATFFFLPESAQYEGHPNADYDITSPPLQQEIQRLLDAGHEVALHGSHASGRSAAQLQAERKKIGGHIYGNRFHYLRFEPALSAPILEELGFTYDSSLGFPEHYGFRNSYCHPFRLFNFQARRMSQVWELPLNLMDVTLHHPKYLQLAPSEVLPAVTPILEEIQRFHGVFTLLWHNENFSPYGMAGGLKMFQELSTYLQDKGSAFLTAQQAINQIKAC